MRHRMYGALALLLCVIFANEALAATIRGRVMCDGQPVKGVMVTDGITATKTSKRGEYELRTDDKHARFIYISVPSGYEVPTVRGFMPDFYQRIEADRSEYNFSLKKVDQSGYYLIVSADIHVRNRAMTVKEPLQRLPLHFPTGELDSVSFQRTYLATLRDYVKKLPLGVKVYGLNLGDMSNESHWRGKFGGDLANFITVCERGGMPIQTYTVIGNHEHDMLAQNIFDDDDTKAELAYMENFGPTYYSFNIGGVHYVVLDNVKYCNHKALGKDRNYEVRITQDQIDWAALDAALLPKDTKSIVIAWHCPGHRRRSGGQPTHNTQAILKLYARYDLPITILSGHNHQAETVTVAGYRNTVEYLHPSVSGAWWYFPVCSDGAPSTFTRYDFKNGRLTARESVNFTNHAEQKYRIYNKGERNEQGEAVLRLNVWDWHFDWRFEVYEDGKRIAKPQIKPIRGRDALYDQLRETVGNGIAKHKFLNTSTTDHFIEYVPENPHSEIRIVATDEFGREYISLTTHIE